MGLNDTYDTTRGQILLIEPLPSLNKAYAMIVRVEKQREVNQVYPGSQGNSAFMAKIQQATSTRTRGGGTSQGRGWNFGRGRGRSNDRTQKFCDYCNMQGHTRDTCFHLNGYPDWYKPYKTQKEGANAVKKETNKATPFDLIEDPSVKQDSVATLLQGLQQELEKIKGKVQNECHTVNLTQVNDYASNTSNSQFINTALHASDDTICELNFNS